MNAQSQNRCVCKPCAMDEKKEIMKNNFIILITYISTNNFASGFTRRWSLKRDYLNRIESQCSPWVKSARARYNAPTVSSAQ